MQKGDGRTVRRPRALLRQRKTGATDAIFLVLSLDLMDNISHSRFRSNDIHQQST